MSKKDGESVISDMDHHSIPSAQCHMNRCEPSLDVSISILPSLSVSESLVEEERCSD